MGIALFGGSFNPVHMGHYEIVRQTLNLEIISRIIVIPAYKNPLKEDVPALPQSVRLEMLSATFAEFEPVEISRYELNDNRTSYTYKTLEHFASVYPDRKIYLLIGEDTFNSFPFWAKIDKVFQLSTPLVYPRIPSNPEKTHQNKIRYGNSIQWIDMTIPDISSTMIRKSSIDRVKRNGWIHPDALDFWIDYATKTHQ